MTYKIERKIYLCIPVIVAILYSVQKYIVCLCVLNYQCQSLWCNALYTKSRQWPTVFDTKIKTKTFESATFSLHEGFDFDVHPWSIWGLSHGADNVWSSKKCCPPSPLLSLPLVLSFCKGCDFAVRPDRRILTRVLALSSKSWRFLLLTCVKAVLKQSMTFFVKARFLGLTKLAVTRKSHII